MDGSDHLTQYYATILDKMNDPRSHELMHRTLDIFNNHPPSTASTAETAELALAGTRAAAVMRADSGSFRSGSGSGQHRSVSRRCLFARRPPSFNSQHHCTTGQSTEVVSDSKNGRVSSRSSAAAAAIAIVSDTRCLFARPGSFATIPGLPVAACRSLDCSVQPPSPPTQYQVPPGPHRVVSNSRRSFSSNICMEVVPEAAEVHCDLATTANIVVGTTSPDSVNTARHLDTAGSLQAQ